MFKSFFANSLLVVMAVAGLAACGEGNQLAPTPTPFPLPRTATPSPPTATIIAVKQPTASQAQGTTSLPAAPVADILTRAATSIKDAQSYHGTYITQLGGNTIHSDFDFQAPDKMHMNYNLAAGKVDIIVLGNVMYGKMPGDHDYAAIPSGGFNVGGVNPAQIIILLNSAQNGQLIGDEQMQGVNTTHVKFTYDTNKVVGEMALQAGQATPTPLPNLGKSTVDAWVDKNTGYIVQYNTSVDMGAGVGTVTSTVVLSKFNEPINPPIVAPSNVTDLPTVGAIPSLPTPTVSP